MLSIGLFNITIEQHVIEEEGTPKEVGLDHATAEDDEEQMLINKCS
jgi:hypothetical protein